MIFFSRKTLCFNFETHVTDVCFRNIDQCAGGISITTFCSEVVKLRGKIMFAPPPLGLGYKNGLLGENPLDAPD